MLFTKRLSLKKRPWTEFALPKNVPDIRLIESAQIPSPI